MEADILLVDDESAVLESLRLTLRRRPYRLHCAESAAEAREILAKADIDLVISDEMMPGERGSHLLADIRQRYPDIISIILSGQADMEAVLRAINDGEVYRFLIKPCSPVDLLQTVHAALQQRVLMRRCRQLLDRCRTQDALLDQLRRDYPDIDQLQRDADGAIVIDDSQG